MIALAAEIVDVGQLLSVVEAALIGGVGVGIAFSLVIRGAIARRRGTPAAARRSRRAHMPLLAIVALAACSARSSFGVSVMLSK